ncbi:MAG: hypothetical protein JWO62_1405 [Acidimicrobiaceae bacterium]|jgi:sugar lactone lactonase YvrE|nr:hypothetical protein [Acidimicrobiaceae bacterium]
MSVEEPVAPVVYTALDAAARIGEGPVWDARTGQLLWVDILDGVVHRFDPSTGRDLQFSTGQPVGFVAPRASGGVVVGLRDGIAAIDASWSKIELLVAVDAEDPSMRMNDGSCDAAGRLFAGTMAFAESAGRGALYRLEPSLDLTVVEAPVTVSNGIDWSPDGTRMYYVDSATHGIDVFDYDLATGVPSARRRLATVETDDGLPDGLTVDSEGYVWVAFWGGWCVRRYAPDGELDRVVRFPTSAVTACAFGGPDLADLYVTTAYEGLTTKERARQPLAGALFRVTTGVHGRAGLAFAG